MSRKKFGWTSLLTSCLILVSAVASAVESGLDVLVTFEKQTNLDASLKKLTTHGKVVSKTTAKGQVTIRLNDPASLQETVKKFKATEGVKLVSVKQPTIPNVDIAALPLSELKELIDTYKESYDAWAVFNGQEREENAKYPGLGYLKAYLQYLEIRAYPNDTIDYSGHIDVAKRRTAERQSVTSRNGQSSNYAEGQGPKHGTIIHHGTVGGTSSLSGDWEFLGPTNLDVPYRVYYGVRPTSGRTNALAFDPTNSDVRYLGGAQGGVWKTTDAGDNWTPLTDDWPLLSISSIAVSPTDPNLVLVGTGDFHGGNKPGIGIYRSTDGGDSWTALGQNLGSQSISDVEFDPDNGNLAFASTGKAGGRVYRTTDGGLTWAVSLDQNADWSDLSIGAEDGGGVRDVWAVGYGTDNVYVSSDDGANWTQVDIPLLSNGQGAMSVACSKVDPDTVYILSASNQRIIKTTDGGANWTDITTGFVDGGGYNWSQAWYDYHIETSYATNGSTTRELVFVCLIDVVMSDDGGGTWKSIGGIGNQPTYSNAAVLHNDQHSFAVDPADPTHLMSGNDGGVYVGRYDFSTRNVNWTPLNRNLGITQFYTFAMFPALEDYMMGGTQDNASPHSHGSLLNWLNETGGDGAGCAINYNNFLNQYGSSQYHGLSRTDNGWQSSYSIRPSFSGHNVPFIGDMWMDPNDPRYVYVNTNYLCRYDANSNSWSYLGRNGGPLTGGRVNAVAIGKNDSSLIYVGTTNGELWMSTDFGANWVAIDGSLPNRAITDISVSPDNNNDILVSVSGTGSAKVFRCTDTSAVAPDWTSVSGTGLGAIPNVSVNTIARAPGDPLNSWYVGTDVGVFFTEDGGQFYVDVTSSKGLPNVQVNKLYANPFNNALYAATFGRGMWRLGLDAGLIKSFTAIPETVFEGLPVKLHLLLKQPVQQDTVFNLTTSNGALTVPASITLKKGAGSAVITAMANEVDSDTTCTVTLTGGDGLVKSVDVTVLDAFLAFPHNSIVSNAVNVSGGVENLQASDNAYHQWQVYDPRQPTSVKYTGRVNATKPSQLLVNLEISSDTPSVIYKLYMYSASSKALVEVGSGIASPKESAVQFHLTENVSDFVDRRGEFIAVIRVTGGKFGGRFTTKVDELSFRFK